MRRVIVEQIDALAELNRIVARHGARRLESRRGVPSRWRRAPRRAPTRRTRRAAATRRRAAASQSAARAAPSRGRAPPAPAGGSGRGGWLTDLLGRASRDEAQPAPQGPTAGRRRRAIESLDSLSVDIARMIDHDAAAELWERYKRGERNVFTRRLYTMQGQKTFEEIRKRYRARPRVQQTVDRYIGEFERLLEEVSRDERGQAMARSYLTSDTGKVYTMLAHAAGRFE